MLIWPGVETLTPNPVAAGKGGREKTKLGLGRGSGFISFNKKNPFLNLPLNFAGLIKAGKMLGLQTSQILMYILLLNKLKIAHIINKKGLAIKFTILFFLCLQIYVVPKFGIEFHFEIT